MNKAALPLMVSTLLAGWLGCGRDACDGHAGTCLTLEVYADPSIQMTRLIGDIRGTALRFPIEHSTMMKIDTPFQYAVANVPDASGDATISVATYLSDKLVAINRTMFVIAPGAHVRVPLMLQPASVPTCSDGVRDGDELGIDCGGDVCGKELKKGCDVGDPCRGVLSMDCVAGLTCEGNVCSLCGPNVPCRFGTCHPNGRCF